MTDLAQHIQVIAKQLSLHVTLEQSKQLAQYVNLLLKWNRAYNLTAVRELDKVLTHHIADSLAIAPYIQGKRILDVGTGAGLPGLPLAIYYPRRQFVLMDSAGKKVRFLRQVVAELSLPNVEPVQHRVENYATSAPFDVIMARAVADLADIVKLSEHVLVPGGQFVLQKGQYPTLELEQLPWPYRVVELDVPQLSAQRHLVLIAKGVRDGKSHSGG